MLLILYWGCFYHLTQATWWRVQAEGLQAAYNSDEGVKTFCGKLDSLAFLPTADVANGMEVLREEAPENMTCLVDYFDANYVNGNFRSVVAPHGNLRLRKTSPRFCPTVWNVHEATLQDRDRTNNQCESWNHSFKHLVGHSNPSLWTVVSCLNKDATMVEADILRCERGEPPKKRVKKSTKAHQQRLKTLCQQYANGQKNIQEFLNAMGQFIRIN
ncbi:uncharacterized protein LOC123557308 [Mercenaria mercenaria]|uniref:uncharacterized protein LOC123557308 n=1 Tax=Mercenaria mercenaria TaxID=6596 RepID=UPI00234EEDFE|nr:uncharacterized protein LOC123557308 [Mercenaria mercenaria]XP_053391566.1 uncharacterized protein LOC123557308 [Mercenaria mercenaria]XP_053391567.1 uncharacterized protein LOC123557308 [Mercenaria mercenaria]